MGTKHASFLREYPYNENRCSFCGKPHWDGDWRGAIKLVLICKNCAKAYLPALYADALWSPQFAPSIAASHIATFASGYTKAQTLNVFRQGGANVPV